MTDNSKDFPMFKDVCLDKIKNRNIPLDKISFDIENDGHAVWLHVYKGRNHCCSVQLKEKDYQYIVDCLKEMD